MVSSVAYTASDKTKHTNTLTVIIWILSDIITISFSLNLHTTYTYNTGHTIQFYVSNKQEVIITWHHVLSKQALSPPVTGSTLKSLTE